MNSSDHPLPEAPGQHRPRAKSNFSFRSHHSNKSSGSHPKITLAETHDEKESRRLHGKADPSMAITEAEPSAVASGVKTSLAPIRAIQHRDKQGNPIADPDRSNPTRSRWERPLDTIRSFEAAIDGGYSRKSYMRKDSAEALTQTRRSSYYANQGPTDDRSRYHQNSYYGARSYPRRPESTQMERPGGMGRPDSYYGMDNGGPNNAYYPNQARHPRAANGVYPAPGGQPSYETVTTASGSGSSLEPAGYLTDPSSDNSSLDRMAAVAAAKEKPSETYGLDGFGQIPQFAPPGSHLELQYSWNGAQQQQQRQGNGYSNQGATPPPPPQKGGMGVTAPIRRVPIKLGSTGGNAGPSIPTPTKPVAAAEKRKSWFGRRFSRAA